MARNSSKSYEIDMLNGPILPKILRFSVPLTLSTMLQLLFNAADVVVVGRYAGDNSLAAFPCACLQSVETRWSSRYGNSG